MNTLTAGLLLAITVTAPLGAVLLLRSARSSGATVKRIELPGLAVDFFPPEEAEGRRDSL
jgi:hypothetical protein